MTREEIIKESRKRHPKIKPINYLQEGRAMGFVEGALWMQQQLTKIKQS